MMSEELFVAVYWAYCVCLSQKDDNT